MKNCVEIQEKVQYGLRLYSFLRTLVNREVELILDDRMDEIEKVLKLREQLMKEVAATEASVRALHDSICSDSNMDAARKAEADRLVESLRTAVSNTMETIHESRATLDRAKSGILAELQTHSTRRKAVAQYSMISNMVLHK